MDYTDALRQAHIASLRQKYLEIIEEAKVEKEEKEKEFKAEAQEAYLERERKHKELPQRLRASGISGGAGEEEAEAIELEYASELQLLEEKRRGYAEEYARILNKQTRLMNAALNEYNAKIALEDSKSTGKTSKAKRSGGSSSNSSASSGATSEPPVDADDILNSAAIQNINRTFGSPKTAGNDTVAQYTPPRRYAVK